MQNHDENLTFTAIQQKLQNASAAISDPQQRLSYFKRRAAIAQTPYEKTLARQMAQLLEGRTRGEALVRERKQLIASAPDPLTASNPSVRPAVLPGPDRLERLKQIDEELASIQTGLEALDGQRGRDEVRRSIEESRSTLAAERLAGERIAAARQVAAEKAEQGAVDELAERLVPAAKGLIHTSTSTLSPSAQEDAATRWLRTGQ